MKSDISKIKAFAVRIRSDARRKKELGWYVAVTYCDAIIKRIERLEKEGR